MKYAETYENPSVLSGAIGVGLQNLGTYDERKRSIMSINMLPQSKSLRRNRQLGVLSTTLSRMLVGTSLLLGVWTIGIVVPQFWESQRVSRDFENLQVEAETIKSRLEGATAALKEAGKNIKLMETVRNPSGKTYLLETLPDLMPDGAELSEMKVFESSKIEIKGYASSDRALYFFQNELELSGLVKNISLQSEDDLEPDDGFTPFTLQGDLGITD